MFKKAIINLFLVIFTLSISFFAIEVFCKIFYPQSLSGSWRTINNKGLILNKSSGDASHYWKEKGKREELFVRYSFGEYNNRIYKNLLVDQSSEKILILGDSFTFGWLLNDEDTFVYNLQKKFINKFFLNSASGGWGTADHLKYLQMYCKKINPKEVWIFVNNSDIDRSIRSNLYDIDNDRKLIELNPKLSLSQKIKVLANSVSFYNFLLENFHSIQLIRIFFTQTPEHNTTFNKKHKFFNDPNSFGKILFIELKKKN